MPGAPKSEQQHKNQMEYYNEKENTANTQRERVSETQITGQKQKANLQHDSYYYKKVARRKASEKKEVAPHAPRNWEQL